MYSTFKFDSCAADERRHICRTAGYLKVRVELVLFRNVSNFGSAVLLTSRLLGKAKWPVFAAAMHEKKRATTASPGDIRANARWHLIPSPATQRRPWKPRSGAHKRWTNLAVLFLVALTFFWTKLCSRSQVHIQAQDDSKYSTLIREYMKYGNKEPNGPLRGSKAEELFL